MRKGYKKFFYYYYYFFFLFNYYFFSSIILIIQRIGKIIIKIYINCVKLNVYNK